MKNMKILTRLILSFTVIIIMVAVLGIVSIINLNAISKSADEIYKNHLVGIKYLSKTLESFEEIRIGSLRTSTGAFLKNEQLMNDGKVQMQQNINSTNENFGAFAEIETIEDILNALPSVFISKNEYLNSLDTFIASCDDLFIDGDTSGYLEALNELTSKTLTIRTALKDIIDKKEEYAHKANEEGQSLANITKTIQIIIMIGIEIFALAITFVISIGIEKDLKKLINKLHASGEAINNTVTQLVQSSNSLAQGTTKQAAAIEETSATMNESAAAVAQSSEHAKQAAEIADEAVSMANNGVDTMTLVIKSMDELKESSATMEKIVKMIDDIAFQTKLLALNATVEAARAGGETGKSFAVVAGEVGSLAERSKKEAGDTTAIIAKNISLTSAEKEKINEAADSLTQISANGNSLNTIIKEINAALEEQATGIKQINAALLEIERVTQDNAALAEENAALSDSMQSEAESLQEAVQIAKNLIRYKEDNL